MKINYILIVKWGVSKGRDTYGYTTCTLKHEGIKVGYCSGGGYDMRGTVLAQFMSREFWGSIKMLDPSLHYGIYEKGNKKWINGSCGLSSMEHILNALYYERKTLAIENNIEVWSISKNLELEKHVLDLKEHSKNDISNQIA